MGHAWLLLAAAGSGSRDGGRNLAGSPGSAPEAAAVPQHLQQNSRHLQNHYQQGLAPPTLNFKFLTFSSNDLKATEFLYSDDKANG